MVSDLHLRGTALTIFAMIYSFTRDGKHVFHASLDYIAEWAGCNRRTVVDSLNVLVKSGYVTKVEDGKGRGSVNGYVTNYEDLMERVATGEEFYPEKITRRAGNSTKISISGEIQPFFTTNKNSGESDKNSGESDKNSGESSSIYKYIINIYNYSCYFACACAHVDEIRPFEQKEQEEVFIKFFLRNAARPREEAARFVALNTQKGWKSTKETYDTPAKRIALSVSWNFKDVRIKLPEDQQHLVESFYQVLASLYLYWKDKTGNADVNIYFNPRSTFSTEGPGVYVLHIPRVLKDRIENDGDSSFAIIRRCFPSIKMLRYRDYEL